MSDIFYALHLVLITREHIFIRSLYHSIHAAEFTQYFAAAFTLPHLCCSTHTTALFHSSHTAAALVPQLSRFNTWAAHSRNSTHAALMQHLSSSTHTAALMLQNSHSSVVSQLSQSHTAAFMQPHAPCSIFGPSIHGTALMLQHSQSQIFTAA